MRMIGTDIVDAAAGLAADSPVAKLRRQRPDFVRYSQGSHDALVAAAEPGGVSLIERGAVALRVAALDGDAALTELYRQRMRTVGADDATITAAEQGQDTAPVPPRLATVLRHVTLVAATPGVATKAHLDGLRAIGLTPRDIVAVAQIIAFVSYQVRVVAGLRLLSQETRA